MKMIIKLILLLLLVVIGLIAAALWGSGAPLTEPPGLMERIHTYLTSNVAETSSHSVSRAARALLQAAARGHAQPGAAGH